MERLLQTGVASLRQTELLACELGTICCRTWHSDLMFQCTEWLVRWVHKLEQHSARDGFFSGPLDFL